MRNLCDLWHLLSMFLTCTYDNNAYLVNGAKELKAPGVKQKNGDYGNLEFYFCGLTVAALIWIAMQFNP